MKKIYNKPSLRLLQVSCETQLLAISLEGEFYDDENYDDWDDDGGQ